ncbi:cytochrome P450 [Gymnopilus junonius]|uniref:Cytochrome P450 n=1 Tax=Gymnopilus junonius TaxID=109634 RepID=A0A9P5NW74_GYMJU|nr:cytochrome P450 [Gymnopilus junonius]
MICSRLRRVMFQVDFLSLVAGGLVIWFIKRVFYSSNNSRNAPYPPGPKPKPFIGNALDFPQFRPYEAYVEWGKRYSSDILYASALGNKILIVNKLEDADELLDRRARKYSDRPLIPIVDLTGWAGNVALLHYGKSWRLSRKLCQQSFRAEAARDFHPLLLKKIHEMLDRLLVNPEDFDEHSKMLSISVPMITMYGYEVESFQDPCIVAAEESIAVGSDLLLPGRSWINTFPILRHVPPWFPGATTRRIAEQARQINKRVRDIPFEFVQKKVAEGTEIPSFVSRFLRRQQEGRSSQEEDEAVRNIAWTVYSGASDTTISATGTFFYLMTIHPEIQKNAQSEIDRVIGPGRLPNFEDRPSLPYIDALYREILRFRPPVPMGVAHALTEDDYYKGYFIPKGTMILPNIWAMTRDESIYPEPLQFKPERFLDANGNLNDDGRVLAYGFGRRICVGKHIGSDTLWIIIASVLASFNIERSKDDFGNEVEVNHDYHDLGILHHKSKFQCTFVPRSAVVKKLIEEAR